MKEETEIDTDLETLEVPDTETVALHVGYVSEAEWDIEVVCDLDGMKLLLQVQDGEIDVGVPEPVTEVLYVPVGDILYIDVSLLVEVEVGLRVSECE